MRADLSRMTFEASKHYAGVLMQQGRVQLDADLNEQGQIQRHRMETHARDVLGPRGVPRQASGGFRIDVTQDGKDLTLGPGRIYVDGILCESTETELPVQTVANDAVKVPVWRVDRRDFAAGQWVVIRYSGEFTVDLRQVKEADAARRQLTLDGSVFFPFEGGVFLHRLTTIASQPDLVASPPTGAAESGRYLAYLDVWERHITPLEDEGIREIALGGPDTACRTKVVWQLKLEKVGSIGSRDCKQFGRDWIPAAVAALPDGALKARVTPVAASATPCVLPPGGGFQGLENQLYRVEVHQGGRTDAGGVTFTWQRDNASVQGALEVDAAGTIFVHQFGRDGDLGFGPRQLAEVTDERTELAGEPGTLVTIDKLDPATGEVVLRPEAGAQLPDIPHADRPKLRRWDGRGEISPPATPDDWITLEAGLQVQFAAGGYKTGDFWWIPARTATSADPGTIEWPHDDDGQPLARGPNGVTHHFSPLALVDFDGTTFLPVPTDGSLDCRPIFPALTTIDAADVHFDGSSCGLGQDTTVERALEVLCERGQGACQISLSPSVGWEAVLAGLQAGQDAQLCFQVGDYTAQDTITLTGLGDVTVTGSGAGTRITIANREAVLAFDGCRSVTVRDLQAESGVDDGAGKAGRLNGTLSFRDCGQVTVEGVQLRCAPQGLKTATCLTVQSADRATATAPGPASVRVRGCSLDVGHGQVGMLLTNVARAQVEDNQIQVRQPPPPAGVGVLLPPVAPAVRARLRRVLMRTATPAVATGERSVVTLTAGGQTTRVLTPAILAGVLPKLLEANPPPAVASSRELLAHLEALTDRVIAGDPAIAGARPLRRAVAAFIQPAVPAAAQGIVVAGRVAREVRILSNTITGAVQGIHLGVSHRSPAAAPLDLAGRVTIAGNTVDVVLPAAPVGERHGIFVGNCDSLAVHDNFAVVSQSVQGRLPIDGVRVHGQLGRRVIVDQNHLVNFTTGVFVRALNPLGGPSVLWLVAENFAPASNPPVDAHVAVRSPLPPPRFRLIPDDRWAKSNNIA